MMNRPYKFIAQETPSNIFCEKCQYWMAYVHAKKIGEKWICLSCLKKENEKTKENR